MKKEDKLIEFLKDVFELFVIFFFCFLLSAILTLCSYQLSHARSSDTIRSIHNPDKSIYNQVSFQELMERQNNFQDKKVAVSGVMGTLTVILSRMEQPVYSYHLHGDLTDLRFIRLLSNSPLPHTHLGEKVLVLGTYHAGGHFAGRLFDNFMDVDFILEEN